MGGVERTEAKQGVERTNVMTHLLAKLPKLNPGPTFNADSTATARAPGLHKPINCVTHLRGKPRRMTKKGGGKQRVSEREREPGMRGTGEARGAWG